MLSSRVLSLCSRSGEDAFVRVLEDLFRHGFREGPYAVEFAKELRFPVSEIKRNLIRGIAENLYAVLSVRTGEGITISYILISIL